MMSLLRSPKYSLRKDENQPKLYYLDLFQVIPRHDKAAFLLEYYRSPFTIIFVFSNL